MDLLYQYGLCVHRSNSFNDGEYSYNNLQDYVATWTHKFNDIVNTQTEAWFMYMKGVPGIGWSPEWAVVNYTFFRVSKNVFFTVRNEYFDDASGQRTGVKDVYSEHAIGFTWWPNSITTIRPELRFDAPISEKPTTIKPQEPVIRRHDRAFLIWRHNLFAGQSRADIPVRGAQRPGPIFSLTKTPG